MKFFMMSKLYILFQEYMIYKTNKHSIGKL